MALLLSDIQGVIQNLTHDLSLKTCTLSYSLSLCIALLSSPCVSQECKIHPQAMPPHLCSIHIYPTNHRVWNIFHIHSFLSRLCSPTMVEVTIISNLGDMMVTSKLFSL